MIMKFSLFFLLLQTNILLPVSYHIPIFRNDLDRINEFISEGYTRDLNRQSFKFGNTPLCLAAELSRSQLIPTLIKNGAKRLKTNNYKQTPLHLAANSEFKNFVDVINMLIAINTEEIDIPKYLNMQDINGDTVLHILARRQNVPQDFIIYLIKQGANIFASNLSTQTPLHVAAQSGNLNMINALLNKTNFIDLVFRNIYVNYKDMYGNTPLHIVINNHYSKINFIPLFSALTKKRAFVLIKNVFGQNALDWAKKKHQNLIQSIQPPSTEVSPSLDNQIKNLEILLFALNQIAQKEMGYQRKR